MTDIGDLMKSAFADTAKTLANETLVGETITLGDAQIVPIFSMGFGLGVGSGEGSGHMKGKEQEGQGKGQGAGAGGGLRPVAIIIADKDGIRVERLGPPPAKWPGELMDTIKSVVKTNTPEAEKDGDSG